MRRVLVSVLSAALVWVARSAELPAREPLRLEQPVQDKNFCLLSMLQRTAAVRQELKADPILARLALVKREALRTAVRTCGTDLHCYTDALSLAEAEIAQAADSLRALIARDGALKRMAAGPLRRSGMFQRYSGDSDEKLLGQSWQDAARAIDQAIQVYGLGAKPRYPAIDSVFYDVATPHFAVLVRNIAAVMDDGATDGDLFFQQPLDFALHLLDASHRDEAGRLEPLEKGENAGALRRIGSVEWSRFPYTAILVPGSGNDRPGIALSAVGKLRLELAARRYHAGKAPLIVVSGGFVHPAQTPYAEAIEMKKALVGAFGVPENAILVDPHARHTTTNLRNAARLIYRYGVPFDRAALVTTDPEQSSAIESSAFARRCLDELGYQPYRAGKRLSAFDLEWFPEIDALQADARDPLDP